MENQYYYLTDHLKERYLEYTDSKYKGLAKKSDKDQTKLLFELKRDLDDHKKNEELNAEIAERIQLADEEKSLFNDTEFMDFYYEKYGFDNRPMFLVHDDITFVVIKSQKGPNRHVVVTCVDARHRASQAVVSRKKFSKNSKKRENRIVR